MVDFKKRLNQKKIEKKVNPIDIYDSLDRRSETGPLRPAQDYILREWFDKKINQKDLIIKLHTGEGKTLIGLLILLSRINSGNFPCLYLCPNRYLANQVIVEAKKFGIPHSTIGSDNSIPDDFSAGRRILITYVQKVFNGKSIFGINNSSLDIDTILLDDSHACIDSIKDAFTISFQNVHEVYKYFLTLFEQEIKDQGEGSFLEITSGAYDTLLPIPYWSWIDRRSEIIKKLTEYREDPDLVFKWPFIKDNLLNYQAFISGKVLEISPYHVAIDHFGSFTNSPHRILMSATTQDDSFFIKGLGFNIDAVKNPLVNPLQRWSGEKMILIPSLIDESLDRITIVNFFATPNKNFRYGVIFLVSSFKKAEFHKTLGSNVATAENIYTQIDGLKKGLFGTPLVLVNRYDGIDLPDETCRILILDSMPFFNSLSDRYEESCRPGSDLINIKIAQRIEQGIGRSVRGEKDYSIIIITGDDLVRFIKSSKTNKYFSDQTRKQIEIGLEITALSEEEIEKGENSQRVLFDLINQSLKRDEGWKAYYVEEMGKMKLSSRSDKIYDLLSLELKSEFAYYSGDYETAQEIMQDIINKRTDNELEKGWYLQQLARYNYPLSVTESNRTQKSAFLKNRQLLKPREGITYKKLEYINENRIQRIKDWINQYTSYQDMMINIDGILSNFSFGIEAEKFEKSVQEIGGMLGFLSDRPDKEYKKGPDNLWCGVDNHYFLFECKSNVNQDRATINKDEAGQMNSHCGWFENTYGKVPVSNILIFPSKNLSYNADFTHRVGIMRKNRLNRLKANIKAFYVEFKDYKIHEISDSKFQELIHMHSLEIKNLKIDYIEDVVKN